jgi:6,7-dimethyl-8-ribityllumazine synthase
MDNIVVKHVPGAFEPRWSKALAESEDFDAIICIIVSSRAKPGIRVYMSGVT